MSTAIKPVSGGEVSTLTAETPPRKFPVALLAFSFLYLILGFACIAVTASYISSFNLSMNTQASEKELIVTVTQERPDALLSSLNTLMIPVAIVLTILGAVLFIRIRDENVFIIGNFIFGLGCLLAFFFLIPWKEGIPDTQPSTASESILSAQEASQLGNSFYPPLGGKSVSQLLKNGSVTLGFGPERITYMVAEDTKNRLVIQAEEETER